MVKKLTPQEISILCMNNFIFPNIEQELLDSLPETKTETETFGIRMALDNLKFKHPNNHNYDNWRLLNAWYSLNKQGIVESQDGYRARRV